MSDRLKFDEATHVYTWDGRSIPHVTQVIKETVGLGWTASASEWYMNRGRSVHACAAMIAQGIDFDVPEGIEGQVQAVREFLRCFKPIVQGVEQRVVSEVFRYAGTVDLVCDGYIVDYKSTVDEDRARLQLAGYAEALGGTWSGIAVELHADGTYKVSAMWRLKKWRGEFLACRTVYEIKERMGELNKERA